MLTQAIKFVQYQLDRTRKLQQKAEARGQPSLKLQTIVAQFEACIEAMMKAEDALANPRPIPSSADRTVLLPADIEGLPPELIAQLSLSEGDQIDFQIHSLIESCGGVMSLDHILIELFRKTGTIHERSKLNARMYRMTQKRLVFDVPKRRGVYSVTPQTAPQMGEGPSSEEGNAQEA